MALLPGSPAIDAGNNALILAGVTTDQRGLGRIANGRVDIGAFESQGFVLTTVPDSTPQTAQIGTAFANPLAVTVTANNPIEPVDGGRVNFVNQPSAGGASALLLTSSAIIAGGQATVIAAPNNAVGSYQVVASVLGSSTSFNLTNVGPILTSLIVNTTSDSLIPGAGLLSLREAIAFANTDRSGQATITFDPTVFATHLTITMTGIQFELSNTTGTETITGPAAGVTVNAGGLSRVFQVDSLVTASISGLTITGGNSGLDGGGGVQNFGILALANCSVSGNSAYSGGGLQNFGTLAMTNCTVSGNSATSSFYGGGGGLDIGGMATLTNCTVSGNSATYGRGGGLDIRGTATLTNCTVSGNAADFGGGLDNSGTATLTSCTVSGNSATGFTYGLGGGMYNSGTLALTICTVSGNSAVAGGGVYN